MGRCERGLCGLTNLLTGATPRDERSNTTTDNGAASGAAAS